MHELNDLDAHLVLRCVQVLPVEVEVRYLVLHQELRSVAKSNHGNNSITAVWMLSWLLEVEDRLHSEIVHLRKHIELSDEPITQSLRSNHQVGHPLRVKALDCWRITFQVVFVFA